MGKFKRVGQSRNWEKVSAIVAIVSILLSISIYLLQRDTKALELRVLSSTSLIEINDTIKGKVQVIYKNIPVSNLTVIEIRIKNTGNQPILESDYTRLITIKFPQQAEIVDAIVIESDPANIGVAVNIEHSNLSFSSILLNQGDESTIRLYVVNLPATSTEIPFSVDGRIVGIKNIDVSTAISRPTLLVAVNSSILILVIAGISILGIYFGTRLARVSRPLTTTSNS